MLLKDQDRIESRLGDFSEHLQGLIKPELAPGERLVWASESRGSSQRSHTVPALLIVALISFVAGLVGLGLAWLSRSDKLGLFGLALILAAFSVGLIAAIDHILDAAVRTAGRRIRRRRVYALTDRRAIIWLPSPWSDAVEIRSYPRGSIRPDLIRRIQLPDGSGDLLFLPPLQDQGGFLGVAQVREVEDLFRRHLVTNVPNVAANDPVAIVAAEGFHPELN